MTNNDILRRLRYAFDISDSKMIALFALADSEVTREQISDWLKKDDDPAYKACHDVQLATFLNGFITDRRGKKDGPKAEVEKRLTNNLIFKKLRIALRLTDDGIIQILSLVKYAVSKHELSAFFRRPDHRQYRECKDQILRNFLHGLQMKHRPDAKPAKTTTKETTEAKKEAVLTPTKTATVIKKQEAAPVEVKKDSKPEFKWQKDRTAVTTNEAKKETAAAKDESKGGKPAFKWNAEHKPTKSKAVKKESTVAPKQSNKDEKPVFKWKED